MRIGLIIAIALLSACSGVELTGSLGIHRVDEYSQQQRQYDKPLKCLFISCPSKEESGS